MDHEIALVWWWGAGLVLVAWVATVFIERRRKAGPVEEPVKTHGKKRKA